MIGTARTGFNGHRPKRRGQPVPKLRRAISGRTGNQAHESPDLAVARGGFATLKIGVTIPNNFGVDDPQQVVSVARLAENLNFDSVWVMDHLFNAGYIRQRLEDKPYYHPLATLSYVAALTSRVVLGTSVMVLPYHNPVELAKYVATLDHFSKGRVILGVGVGSIAEEYAALGIAMSDRARLANESLRLMKELWTNPTPSFESPRWRFSDVRFSPKPLQKPHPPVWVGGESSGARKRAALLGDGWHPNGLTPDAYAAGCQEVRGMADAAGRDSATLTMSIRLGVSVVDEPPPPSGAAGRARLTTTDTDSMIDSLRAYEEAGATYALLGLDSGDVDLLTTAMNQIATKVLPAVR
jgi:probable F420-dependent oxidoreductase